MKKLNPVIVALSILLVAAMAVPALLVLPFSSNDQAKGKLGEQLEKPTKSNTNQPESSIEVSVFRSNQNTVEKLPLEKYVAGVVAAEMPADFEKEALKAQALSARTFIVKKIMNPTNGTLPQNADVTDTIQHQVYKNQQELKGIWGKGFDWKMKKIEKAVSETAGQILTYNGEPIEASFFSTSNGFTENSESYWNHSIPYLKSVESPWDKNSPKFQSKKSLKLSEFEAKLGVKLNTTKDVGIITARTPGKRVATVKIGNQELTGREVREKLDLRSTDFSWVLKGDEIIITTKGYGHGVGMSQYGANGMAKEGKNYKEIVKHYYQDVEISPSEKLLANQTTARK
ncbi:stage II sporulation protein D [Oikeobacillus pervagus]|uniref:Stage II sporulation protein D n=1 Tax=Oikeobacillus pervagus TaxID=1325931 RepID=A0AAJ1SWX8_9BACI|nr:stage II sporulation protein D [Oikeobacillus pervagus]MDQ0214124.1 stage II sporulation protein D [Oikeobacillus pervagus]